MESLDREALRRCLRIRILVGEVCPTFSPTETSTLVNEYGKEEDSHEIENALRDIGFAKVSVHRLNLGNYVDKLDEFEASSRSNGETLVFFTLLDGTERDGYPGLSVVQEIERRRIPFTGADSHFYHLSTAKTDHKALLQIKNVSTANFAAIDPNNLESSLTSAADTTGFPMIIKPSISYSSSGISDKSVVHTHTEAASRVREILAAADLEQIGCVFVEKFLPGREFTALITGDAQTGLHCFTIVEVVFRKSLPTEQRFLAFDRYWNGYGLRMTEPSFQTEEERQEAEFYHYETAPPDVEPRLRKLVLDAYTVLNGNGYARFDIRSDDEACTNLYVLEVNANCGLSFGLSSSVGEILRTTNVDTNRFVQEILMYAFRRPASVEQKRYEGREQHFQHGYE